MAKYKQILKCDISNTPPRSLSHKVHRKNFWGRITYAVIPFLIFVVTLLVTYFGNQLLNRPGTNYPELPIDAQIPLVPWFVYFYFLTFPLGLVTFFYLAYTNKRRLYDLFLTLVISFAISGVIYFFWQTEMTKPVLEPTSFTNRFLLWTWGSTNPINCFPSQHCFMAIAMIIACITAGKKMKLWFKIPTIFVAIMIILSTVFLKQHFLLDFVASLVIMVPIFLIIRFCNFGKWAEKKFSKKYRYSCTQKVIKEK